ASTARGLLSRGDRLTATEHRASEKQKGTAIPLPCVGQHVLRSRAAQRSTAIERSRISHAPSRTRDAHLRRGPHFCLRPRRHQPQPAGAVLISAIGAVLIGLLVVGPQLWYWVTRAAV